QPPKETMGRPREFDPDAALDAAMAAFWDRGYEATSMADLMAVMGLQKGSIYKAFGDKRQLYLAALRRYLERASQQIADRLRASPTALGALEEWLASSVSGRCTGDAATRG